MDNINDSKKQTFSEYEEQSRGEIFKLQLQLLFVVSYWGFQQYALPLVVIHVSRGRMSRRRKRRKEIYDVTQYYSVEFKVLSLSLTTAGLHSSLCCPAHLH